MPSPLRAVLVLGMTFQSPEWVAQNKAAPRWSHSWNADALRDHPRLLQLERSGAFDLILTANLRTYNKETDPERLHVNLESPEPALDAIASMLSRRGARLDAVYADYFLPDNDEPMMQHNTFLHELLPALVSRGMLGIGAHLILPNWPREHLDVVATVDKQHFSALPGVPLRFQHTLLAAKDYPLSVASEHLHRDDDLGGKGHAQQLVSLNYTSPFVKFVLTDPAAVHIPVPVPSERVSLPCLMFSCPSLEGLQTGSTQCSSVCVCVCRLRPLQLLCQTAHRLPQPRCARMPLSRQSRRCPAPT